MGVIMAGLRVAAVTSVGVATIAAAVGAGGLGTFIFQGLTMVNNNVILAGAVPAAILLLLAVRIRMDRTPVKRRVRKRMKRSLALLLD